MADYTGSIGLDISEFEEGISELMEEIPQLEAELKQLNAQMAILERTGKTTGSSWESMKRQQEDLNGILSASKKQLSDFNAVVGDGEKKTLDISKGISTFGKSLAALGLSLTVAGLVSFGKSLLNFSKEVKDASLATGVLPENLQRIQAALSGMVSADDTTSALHAINAELRAAKAGSADAEYRLKQLGITFDDIRSKSPDEVLKKIADYVKNAKDPVEALRAVTNMFGDDLGAKLIPALKQGGDAIGEMAGRAKVASDEQIDAAAKGQKALERWGNAFKQFSLSAISELDKLNNRLADMITNESMKSIREGFFKGAVAYEENDPRNPRNRDKPNPANYKGGRRVQGKGGSQEEERPSQVSALSIESELLKAQSEIARKMIPEYEKQAQLLEVQRKSLEGKLSILDKSRTAEREQLELQISQNFQAQKSLELAAASREVQIELNKVGAEMEVGYEARRKMNLAEINALNKQYEIASRINDQAAMAAILDQKRKAFLNQLSDDRAFKDANRALKNQTLEIEAQSKGMLTLAKTYETIEKFQQQILQAHRDQNTEAAALLLKQQKLAQQAGMAAQARVTPSERNEARNAARAERRDAKKQQRREDEAQKSYDRGARGKRLNELIASRNARLEAEKNQTAAKGEKTNQSIDNIAKDVSTLAGAISNDS
jgi:hypothetical protein